MARVILVFNKKVIKEYPFLKDSMTIGRNQENDIFIDNLVVSSHHAKLDKSGDDYILTDLQSTNGTFVNNRRITSHKLQHKDKITIGKHLLFFAMSTQEQTKPKSEKQIETITLDAGEKKELLEKHAIKNATDKSDLKGKIGAISFIDRPNEGEIQLSKKLTKIGKAETSEIRISGLFMPPTAAIISLKPQGYAITAATTKTKVKVNNEVIKETYYLKDFDIIKIGSHEFQFYSHDLENEK